MPGNFVLNSTSTAAVRKSAIVAIYITEPSSERFILNVRTESNMDLIPNLGFEEGNTVEEVQAKAAAVLAALEEE